MARRRYPKRYWRDANDVWRDRHNYNRPSKGPKRKVDKREYPKRAEPPPTWKPKPREELYPPPKPPRRKPPVFKERPPTERVPLAFPPLTLFSSPFREFLTIVPTESPRTLVTVYAIVKRTDAKYITDDNVTGARIFGKPVGTFTRSQARKLTVADLRERIAFDPDGLLSVLALKGRAITAKGIDPTRSAIATQPKMWRYLRWLDKKTGVEPPAIKPRKRKPGGKGKRKRFKQSR